MNGDAGLLVCVGDPGHSGHGWLNMHGGDDADLPLDPRDDLPFEDRSVDVMTCGPFIATLRPETCVQFLLECRRVLKPGGLLELCVANPGLNAEAANRCLADIAHAAALTGLEATSAAQVADACRNALAKLPARNGHAFTLEYTKRDRGVSRDPLVSIVIPAYSPRFFAACLDSAVAQTYANLEIVVCDDSEGREIEALTLAHARRREVRYLRNAVRLHGRGNFTKCFENARGEFIKFLCDDDLLAPACVASLLDAFRRAPDIALATSHRRRLDENNNALDDQPATLPIVAADATIAGYTLANAMLMAGLNMVGEPTTALFRKADLLDQAPDYFRFNGTRGLGVIDMVMWTALLLKGDAVYLTESLSTFRIHAAQRQRDPEMAQRNAASLRELQAAWLEFKLFDKVSPHLILAKPYPPPADADWRLQPVLSPFAVSRIEPTAEHRRQ